MTAQTRTEYLLDRVAERLGVPKPAEGQVAFAPEPLGLLQALADLFVDGKAAQKKIAEFATAVDKAREADAATKKAEANRTRIYAEIDDAQKRHDEKLAGELAAHTVEMQRRAVAIEQRERAADKRAAELDEREAKLQDDRVRLNQRLAAVRAAVG